MRQTCEVCGKRIDEKKTAIIYKDDAILCGRKCYDIYEEKASWQ